MLFFAAPLQGFTQAAWRHIHASMFPGAVDAYFTPFLRMEGDAPRGRDVRDIASPLNSGLPLIAQVIARDAAEFSALTDIAATAGATRIDLNAGCPYPMLTKRGRGTALIENPDALRAIAAEMHARPHLRFSMKMRLGLDNPLAWETSLSAIDAMPLEMLTIHPRTARQLYKGELHTSAFTRLLNATRHRIVFNGDLCHPDQIAALAATYPTLHGVMAGRGLLARPTLASELRTGRQATPVQILHAALEIHLRLLDHFQATLCGPAQILAKIKPYLDYLPSDTLLSLSHSPSLSVPASPLLPRKTLKTLHKSSTPTAYRTTLLTLL